MKNKNLQKLANNNNFLTLFKNTNEKTTLFEKKLKNEKEGIFSPKPIKFFKEKQSRFDSLDQKVTNFDLEIFPNCEKNEEIKKNGKNILDFSKKTDFSFLKFPLDFSENLINFEKEKKISEDKNDFLITAKTTIELDKSIELDFDKKFQIDFSVKNKKKIKKKKKSRKYEDNHKMKIKIKKLNFYWKKNIKHMPNVFKIKAKILNSQNFVLQFLDFSSKKLLIRDDDKKN